jgi:hypothetical protein
MLVQARSLNAAAGVTGMLVFSNGNFMQVLEGPPQGVHQTLTRIRRDTRHTGLSVLRAVETQTRHFPQWSMAFECVQLRDELIQIPGYQDVRNLSKSQLESTAQNLVSCFTSHMVGVG